MKIFINIRYTYENVRRYHDSINYVFTIIKAVKSIQSSLYSQLYFINNDLKTKFQRDFIISNETTTMNFFIRKIEVKKKI